MIEQTMQHLRDMRLSGFIEALREQHESTQYSGLAFDERLSLLVDREYMRRKNNRVKASVRQAKLKQMASVDQIDFEISRKLDKAKILELANGKWIYEKQNIIITGPTGAGKTFVASALADKACRMGLQAQYYRTHELASEVYLAKADGSYPSLISRMAKTKVLIFDEWLRDPLTPNNARLLLDILDERYKNNSNIFCSQIPVEQWFDLIQDPTIADAILDRIVHNSHRINISGESMRKKTASLRSD